MTYSLDNGRLIQDESDPHHIICHAMRPSGSCLVVELVVKADRDEPVLSAHVTGWILADGVTSIEYDQWRTVSSCPAEPLWMWLHEGPQFRELQAHAEWLALYEREVG